jgi:3-hydroxyacyl-CoA dehydrogenase
MNSLVEFSQENGIAIITINNPPLNALTPGVPEGISEAIQQVEKNDDVKAAVLVGAGRNFLSSADIEEFGKITSGQRNREATFLPFLLQIENCRKAVVVAIHGSTMGGGFELAMAGHYRVAVPTAQVGQPEVNLGLIPGAAGTQRLPRLAGVAKAVEMCAEGKPVSARDAFNLGIVDKIIEGDLLAGAIAFAREVASKPVPKTRERNEKLGASSYNAPVFASAREKARTKQRNLIAPLAAIEAVEASIRLSFEEGCQVEQDLFSECLFSDQSKALIHVLFGEREVAKIPDVPNGTPTIPVTSVGVVGAGMMGGGIAMVFANAGIPVLLKDTDQAALGRGIANIQKNYATSVKRRRFTQEFVDERLKLIKPTLKYDDFSTADMVIEAVFESMALKREVFNQLDAVCKNGAILASNTSTLNVDEIASATSRPQFVIGTHFFSPANVMRLLEIVRGRATSKNVIATCMQLAKKIGKVGVLVGNCRGFVGNRMFHLYRREAQFLVEEGAGIEAVDKALYDFGMAMGPLTTADLAGLDVGWRVRKEHRHLQEPGIRQALIEDRLCEMGRYGQKTDAGWYKYDENRRQIYDPELGIMVRDWVAAAGIEQRQIPAEEIVDRCMLAMVNEGARILEEGVALRAVDIDIIYVSGYGFPAYRGGPMWYADTIGLRKVYDRVRQFEEQHGKFWEPASLLKRLAEENETFAKFSRE